MKHSYVAELDSNGVNGGHQSYMNRHHDRLNDDRKDTSLTILVARAGIGDLTAAIALRQQCHIGKTYEQSQVAAERGAAIQLAPKSNGILCKVGTSAESFGSNLCDQFTAQDEREKVLRNMDVRENNKLWQHQWVSAHRVHLHDGLRKAATSAEGNGRPAKLYTKSSVQSVDESDGTLTLETGEAVQGDVIVGADGVHSVTRTRMAPNTKPFGSGKSAICFLVAGLAIKEDLMTSRLAGRHGKLEIWYEADRRIIMYPTSNNQLLNFVCIHPRR